MVVIKRLLLIVFLFCIGINAYSQAGGYTNAGQDLFRWDADSASGTSVASLAEPFAGGKNISSFPNGILSIGNTGSFVALNTGSGPTTGNDPAALIINNTITFEGMFSPNKADVNADNYVLESNGGTYEGTLKLSVNRGIIKLQLNSGEIPGNVISYSPPVISSEGFIHVAFTKTIDANNLNTIKLYYNGSLVYTSTPSAYVCVLDYDLAEGSNLNSYTGLIDNIRIWGAGGTGTPARTDDQIKDYAFAEILPYPTDVYPVPANMLLNYMFLDYQNVYGSLGIKPLAPSDINSSTTSENPNYTRAAASDSRYYIQSISKGIAGFSCGVSDGLGGLTNSYANRVMYTVFETPGNADLNLPQVLYKEGTGIQGYVLSMYNGILSFSYYTTKQTLQKVSYPVTLNPLTRYIVETRVTANGTSNTKIALYVNGVFAGETGAFSGNVDFTVTRSEVAFGIALNGVILPTQSDYIIYSHRSSLFRGKLFEYVVRNSENSTQQLITTNFLATNYGLSLPASGTNNVPDIFTENTVYNNQAAGVGYLNTTDNQLATNSVIRIEPAAGTTTFWAHNGAATNVYDIGYNSNTQNAPLNVRLEKREWQISGQTGSVLENASVNIFIPVSKYASLIPAGQQLVVVVDPNKDGNYRNDGYVVVLKLNAAGTAYEAKNVPMFVNVNLPSRKYARIRIGYLNQYEFAAAFPVQYTYIGKTNNYSQPVAASTDNLLKIDNVSNQAMNSYVLVQNNNLALAFNSTLVMNDNTGAASNVKVTDRIWRFNIYGTQGKIDIAFLKSMLPALPAGTDQYAIVLDQDGVFNAATSKVIVLTDIALYRKAFFQSLSEGYYMKLAAVKQNQLQVKALPNEVSTPTIAQNTTLTLNADDQYSFDVVGGCPQEMLKSVLKVSFNTGTSHTSGDLIFTASVNLLITGYSDFAMSTAPLFTHSTVLNLDQTMPEKIWNTDITGYYPMLKKVKVVISSFVPCTAPLVTPNLRLKMSIEDQKKFQTPTTASSVIRDLNVARASVDAASERIFSWTSDQCPTQYYQVQILRLYNQKAAYDLTPGFENRGDITEETIEATIDWNKALTIETPNTSVQMLLTEGTGFYVWRVRPIGNYYPGGISNSRNWGNWSTDNYLLPAASSTFAKTGLTANAGSVLTSTGNTVLWYDQFDRDKNFAYSRSFSEGGNIHEGINYISSLGQQKQSIVRLNSNGTKSGAADQELLVSQTVYDFAGRSALSSLPAPVSNDNDISYQEQFLKQTGQLYTPFNFDTDPKYKTPDQINDGSMHTYYSDANPDLTIPSADGYGFTRMLFNNDGTNSMIEQSGVGSVHTLTADRVNSHTVKIVEGGVSEEELIIVFGDEAPASSTVFKTVTTDQNNVSSITYTNKEGQVIATCLAKRVLKLPDGATDMPYYTDELNNTTDPLSIIPTTILVNNNLPFGDRGLQASKTLVLTETTVVKLDYKITPSLIKDVCGTYCAKCGYVLKIKIIDAETGVIQYTNSQTLAMASQTDNNCTPTEIIPIVAKDVTLLAGKYIVSRQIVPDKNEAAKFAADVVKGEDDKLDLITQEFYTRMKVPGITYDLAFAAYKKLIEDGYTNASFDVELFDGNGVSVLNTVSGSGPFSGELKRGYKLVLKTSCCSLNVLVELPAKNPCDDAAVVSSITSLVINNGPNSSPFADAMMAAYAAEKNIDVTAPGFNYATFKILADPVNGTLTADDWSGYDFRTLISNMTNTSLGYAMTRAQCKKMWTCWNASAISAGNSKAASTRPENTGSTLNGERNNTTPSDGTTVSMIGANFTVPPVNIVEMVLDCYGRSYIGWTNVKSTYKENAFRVFLRQDVPTELNPHYCDKIFCSGIDLSAPITPANQQQVVCANVENCQLRYPSPFANIIQLRVINAGMSPAVDKTITAHTDYQTLKGCLQGYATIPSPATNLNPQKIIADAQLTVANLTKQCKDQCQARDAEFRQAMLRIYDPAGTGTYKYYNTGVELAVNGNFDLNLNGWYHINGAAFVASNLSTNGKYKSSGDVSYAAGIKTGQILQGGKKYRLTFELKNNIAYPTGTKIFIKNNGTVLYTITDAITYTESIVFTTTAASGISFETQQVYTGCNPCVPVQLPVDFTLDNVTIREVLFEDPLTKEDVCCMAQSLTDYCKQQCQLTVVTADCGPDGIPDKMVRIGTDAQAAKWSAIMYGSFQLAETSTVGGVPDQCGTGWDKIIPDVNLTTPAACLNGEIAKVWDKASTGGNVVNIGKDEQNNLLVLYPGLFKKIDYLTGVPIWQSNINSNFSSFVSLGGDEFLFIGNNSSVNGGDIIISRQKYNGANLIDTYSSGFTRNFGGSGLDLFYDIIKTDDGFAIGATSESSPNTTDQNLDLVHGSRKTSLLYGEKDYWFFKIDLLGNGIPNTQFTFGGDYTELLYALRTDDVGNFYLIGNSSSSNSGNKTVSISQGLWVVKIKKDLTISSQLNISSFGTQDLPVDVIVGTEDEYFFLHDGDGQQSISNKYYIRKHYGSTQIWDKLIYDGGTSVRTVPYQFVKSSDAGYYILGTTTLVGPLSGSINHDPFFGSTDYFVVKTDLNFDHVWNRTFGGTLSEYPNAGFYTNPGFYNGIHGHKNIQEINGVLMIGGMSISQSNAITGIGNRTDAHIGSSSAYDAWLVGVYSGSNTTCSPKHVCIKWIPLVAPGDPVPPSEPPLPEGDPDTPTLIEDILSNLDLQRAQCGAMRYSSLVDQYLNACVNGTINDLLKVSYGQGMRHYTLYYYDRAGNLSRTVPPAGINKVALDVPGLGRQTHPQHRLVTTYEYNSIGHLITQKTPDGGRTNFIYNTIGQLRFSQNEAQAAKNTCSYTKYDGLGRIIEVGECNLATAGVAFSVITPYADANGTFTAYGSKSFPITGNGQQTINVYTAAATQASYLDKGQTHLRNRISYTYTYAINGERAVSYYSYDPHGNVTWVMQEIPGMTRNTIGYDYDLISSKVLCAKYNEGQNDAFYHKYNYDADNRITAVLTSRDRIVWDKDASYSYYKHGIIKRTGLGEDDVQGLDYTYTIQGWLKAINKPSLLAGAATDDGGASSSFAGDEYGMTLNYFKGDFTRTASPIYNPKTGTAGANTFVSDANKQLFNGNINSWVSRVQQEYRDYLLAGNAATTVNSDKFTTANYYSYDDLNRITASAFSEFSSTGATSANGDKFSRLGATGKYATAYSYDPNGNINSLKRYSVDAAGAALMMDNMIYGYRDASLGAGATGEYNQLTAIQDAVGDATFGNNIDIDNWLGTRYDYDKIGNLITDFAEGIDITWTVYGKVSTVKRRTTTSGKAEVRYTYDAMGHRIKKEVNTEPYNGSGVAQRLPDKVITTYYVNDASGNVMSIYERRNTAVPLQTGYYTANYTQTEIPIYGSSRLGTCTPDVVIASKKFHISDMDNMLYDRALTPRSNYDAYWNVATRENISITNTLAASIGINSTTLYGMTNSGNATTGVYTATPTKLYTFSGKSANGIAHGLNESGQSVFTAFSAEDYFGTTGKLMILSGANKVMMKGSETLLADASSHIAITPVPGTTSKYYVITQGVDDINLRLGLGVYVVDMSLPGYGTVGAPLGEVVEVNGALFNPFSDDFSTGFYTSGKSLLVRENKVTGKTLLYTTRYAAPQTAADECGHIELIVFTLPSDPTQIWGLAPELMCRPIGLIDYEPMPPYTSMLGGEEQAELSFNATGDELLIYNTKKRLGWFSHQDAEVLSYELGYDGKIAKNAIAAKFTVVSSDPSLPSGSSVAVSADGRFVYYTKDQLYKTNGAAAHIWRYDTRNGSNVEVSGQNIAGDLRNLYSGLLVEVADNKSQTAVSLQETDLGVTQGGLKNIVFSAASGQIANWPLQNFRLYGMSKVPTIAVRNINKKKYELSDHLGNVTVVVSDQKTATGSVGSVVTTIAKVASYTNYYAFGMAVKPRSGNSDQYRYGYNGKEHADEIEMGDYDYGARMYDARIAVFFSTDPLKKYFPTKTPYNYAGCSPILYIDVNGAFQLSFDTKRDYPLLENVLIRIGQIADANDALSNPMIQSFLKWSGHDNTETDEEKLAFVRSILSYGKGPYVEVDELADNGWTPNEVLNEKTKEGVPNKNFNKVYLNSEIADQLSFHTPQGIEALFVTFIVVFHEGVHYADVRTDKTFSDQPQKKYMRKSGVFDAGVGWEQESFPGLIRDPKRFGYGMRIVMGEYVGSSPQIPGLNMNLSYLNIHNIFKTGESPPPVQSGGPPNVEKAPAKKRSK